MIYLGIDDTDVAGSPGTNQLARAIVKRLGPAAEGAIICRHQLLFDPRVPYTSKNGSASIVLPRAAAAPEATLIAPIHEEMRSWFIEGSDPGLCVTSRVPGAVRSFGQRCQHEVVDQGAARELAAREGLFLEGLGGTEDGVIGALAAVGLAATGEDGRVVQRDGWPWPDEFSGPRDVAAIRARGIDEIRALDSAALVTTGVVDVGKHLRPNVRRRRIVLFVEPAVAADGSSVWKAVKLA